MKDFIILKETHENHRVKSVEAFTTLTHALRSEYLLHLYDKVRKDYFSKNQPFVYGAIIYRKIKLNQSHKWNKTNKFQDR